MLNQVQGSKVSQVIEDVPELRNTITTSPNFSLYILLAIPGVRVKKISWPSFRS